MQKEYFDPKGDPMLPKQILDMMARGEAYHTECEHRRVKFLPKQVMRPVFATKGLSEGPMLKPRKLDFLILDV